MYKSFVTLETEPFDLDEYRDKKDRRGALAVIGLILGVLGMFTWLIPVAGALESLAGIVVSAVGLTSKRKAVSAAGLLLCSISVVGSIVYGVLNLINHNFILF